MPTDHINTNTQHQAPESGFSPFDCVPDEILTHILSFLDDKDLNAVSSVSTRFYGASHERNNWQQKALSLAEEHGLSTAKIIEDFDKISQKIAKLSSALSTAQENVVSQTQKPEPTCSSYKEYYFNLKNNISVTETRYRAEYAHLRDHGKSLLSWNTPTFSQQVTQCAQKLNTIFTGKQAVVLEQANEALDEINDVICNHRMSTAVRENALTFQYITRLPAKTLEAMKQRAHLQEVRFAHTDIASFPHDELISLASLQQMDLDQAQKALVDVEQLLKKVKISDIQPAPQAAVTMRP